MNKFFCFQIFSNVELVLIMCLSSCCRSFRQWLQWMTTTLHLGLLCILLSLSCLDDKRKCMRMEVCWWTACFMLCLAPLSSFLKWKKHARMEIDRSELCSSLQNDEAMWLWLRNVEELQSETSFFIWMKLMRRCDHFLLTQRLLCRNFHFRPNDWLQSW